MPARCRPDLTVGDNGSGRHTLNLAWGNIDPLPSQNDVGKLNVTERSSTTRRGMIGSSPGDVPIVEQAYNVDLLPATGGSNQRRVHASAGELLNLHLECRTHVPGAFATTPPSAPFGWSFPYRLS